MLVSIPILLANLYLLLLLLEVVGIFFVVLATDGWLPSLKLLLRWDLVAIINAVLLADSSIILLVVCVFLLGCQKVWNAIHYWTYLVALLGRLLHNPGARVAHRLNYHVVEVVLAFTELLNIRFTSIWLLLYVLLRHLLLHMLLLRKWGLVWVCMHHCGILDLLHLNLKSFRFIEVIALDRYLLLCVQVLELDAHGL